MAISKSIALTALLLGSCSQTAVPVLPAATATQLENAFVVDDDELLNLARTAESHLKYSQCLAYLKDYASRAGVNPDTSFWQWQARVAEQAGDYDSAIKARTAWLELDPADPWIRVDIADDLAKRGNLEEAFSLLSFSLDDADDQKVLTDAHLFLLEYNGLYQDGAEMCLRLADASDSSLAKLYYQKASILFEQAGLLEDAVEAISHALDSEQLDDVATDELQRLRAFELGEPQNVADARRLLYLHQNEGHRLIGIRYLMRGDYPSDLADFVHALADSSQDVVEVAISQIALRGAVSDLSHIENFLGATNNHQLRIAAIRAFASLGNEAHADLILPHADVQARDLFRAWRMCLEQLTGHTIGVGLDPNLEERNAIVRAWRQYLSN
jgi:tetratricopeptide (TPR) repeat protein